MIGMNSEKMTFKGFVKENFWKISTLILFIFAVWQLMYPINNKFADQNKELQDSVIFLKGKLIAQDEILRDYKNDISQLSNTNDKLEYKIQNLENELGICVSTTDSIAKQKEKYASAYWRTKADLRKEKKKGVWDKIRDWWNS